MEIRKGILSFFLFVIAAIYITFPLVFHISDRVTGFGDELVIAWIQNWVIHALTTNPLALFEANLYYPYHNTLAFTETFTLTSILAIPIRMITGEPISTVNFTFISSLIFLGFSIYCLCYYLTRNFILSVLGGMLVVFSPAVLDYTVHLQVLSLECVPLAILFFLHFIKSRKTLFFAISLLFFVLQVYNSIMPGYFILFSYIVILLFNTLSNKEKTLQLFTRKNTLLLIFALSLISPIALAYYSVSNEFNYVRDIRDAVHLAFQPEDFLYPGNRTRLHDVLMHVPTNHYSQNNEFKPGYLGFIFSFLTIFTIMNLIKRIRKSIHIKSFLSISLIGFILSLGPVLHLGRHTIHTPFLIPLPYALFYYVIPGFQGLRNSGRWNMLFIIAFAVVIVLVLNEVLKKFSPKKQFIIYIVLFLGILIELSPLKLYSIPQKKDFPPVYHWIATTPVETKIIEMPIYNWNMDPFTGREIWREYFGTIHFRKTVNGYTGFSPPPWQDLVKNQTENFPSDETLKQLKKMDIQYIIIHTDEYTAMHEANFVVGKKIMKDGEQVIKEIDATKSLKFVKRFNESYIYEMTY